MSERGAVGSLPARSGLASRPGLSRFDICHVRPGDDHSVPALVLQLGRVGAGRGVLLDLVKNLAASYRDRTGSVGHRAGNQVFGDTVLGIRVVGVLLMLARDPGYLPVGPPSV